MERDESSGSFKIGKTAQERGSSYVPECYKVQYPPRSSSDLENANIPVIDLSMLRKGHVDRSELVKEIGHACSQIGFFQIMNHGISQSVLDEALSSAFEFFKLPSEAKLKFMSNDVYKPVRYGTSLKDGYDKVQFWRVFLKHYAHPLSHWIDSWPENPPHYRICGRFEHSFFCGQIVSCDGQLTFLHRRIRKWFFAVMPFEGVRLERRTTDVVMEKMGKFCEEVRKLALELMSAITESLEIGPTYLSNKMEDGMQVIAVNCYPPCPNPKLALGLPPHSDYSCITIVLQSSEGLEILDKTGDRDKKWRKVPELRGVLQVHVGDHLEVLSNGLYKSVVHRATLSGDKTRISIASLHSLGMEEKMGTAKELVDDQNPVGYKESSFRDFLDFLTNNDIAEGKSFINTLKIKN